MFKVLQMYYLSNKNHNTYSINNEQVLLQSSAAQINFLSADILSPYMKGLPFAKYSKYRDFGKCSVV